MSFLTSDCYPSYPALTLKLLKYHFDCVLATNEIQAKAIPNGLQSLLLHCQFSFKWTFPNLISDLPQISHASILDLSPIDILYVEGFHNKAIFKVIFIANFLIKPYRKLKFCMLTTHD